MESRQFTCIVCPRGCLLTVVPESRAVTGNTCERGAVYGLAEVENPVRVLTSTVKVRDRAEMLPVRTKKAIPKRLLFEAMKEIDALEVRLPVTMGQTLKKNIADSGIDLVASRSLK